MSGKAALLSAVIDAWKCVWHNGTVAKSFGFLRLTHVKKGGIAACCHDCMTNCAPLWHRLLDF